MPRPKRHPDEPALARAVGRTIRVLRRQRRMKAEVLALDVGTRPQTVSHWETGRCLPTIPHLLTVCRVLNVRMSALLAGAEAALRADAVFKADARHLRRSETEDPAE